MSCVLEDAVSFEPLGGVTSIFFDDKTHQVRNKIFSTLTFWPENLICGLFFSRVKRVNNKYETRSNCENWKKSS